MTTVLLATPYYPPSLGGVQQYVWNLARMLRKRHGWRVVVATTSDAESTDDIPVYRLPVAGRISNTPVGVGWTRALRRIIRDEQIDVINAHGPVPLFADAARRAAGDVPFVLTYHAGRMRTGRFLPDMVCAIYEKTVLAATARRSAQLICASDHVADELPELFDGRHITIEPGADLELFRPAPLPDEQRIVFAASLEHQTAYKGLPDLLRAVVRLDGVHLEVVGTGSAEGDHRRLAAELGIAERVTFAGHLKGADLAAAYRRARVLALPTHFDNYPTVIVEAMATGRPIVSTRVGAIPTVVGSGERGLLVDAGDIPALTGALRAVLTDDELAGRLGAAGAAFVANELSWNRQSDRTAEVLARNLQRRQDRPVVAARKIVN
ncbi:glycosyltransferase family 4 protein [Paractinoplanes durhamensis]|uniref:LPS biosynthesis rfbu related protein n=1 Tax=Paractinoplanes durhamensis TaxID=113563 RepID=A0ABQ3Z9X0_9ACTN|nr:glycosyltransferase family 4 protein [Actinoplanes durhamensis]GIE06626.1 LPS biosynthesis rfbu related protein [Actinoplanes durhamensis]